MGFKLNLFPTQKGHIYGISERKFVQPIAIIEEV